MKNKRIKVIKKRAKSSRGMNSVVERTPIVEEKAPRERGIKGTVDSWISDIRERREQQNLMDQQMFFGGVSS